MHETATSRATNSRRRLRAGLLALVALGAATPACGAGSTSRAAPGSTTTSTTTTPLSVSSMLSAPSTVAAPVTAAPVVRAGGSTTTPTVAPGPVCPAKPFPPGATDVTMAAGSFDGDGHPDVLMAYRDAGAWHLRAQLSAAGDADVVVPDVGIGDVVKAVGGFNVDADAIDEAFATVGSGAYTSTVGIWKVGGLCQLTRITIGGQPGSFPVGASVRNRTGLRCVAGTAMQTLGAQSSNGTQYTGTVSNYDLVGTTLVLANSSPPQALADTDPGLVPYGRFTCGALMLP